MQPTDDINLLALEALRKRVTEVLPAQIRTCIEQLSEEQLWWRPNDQSNSVANLVLHVRGAVLHFLCRGVGGLEYQRDRAAEFSAQGSLDKTQLLAMFDEMTAKAAQTFAALEPANLNGPSSEPAYYTIVFEDLFGIAMHLASHAGQIVYVTKMLKEGSVNDLWTETHRNARAWKT